MLCFAIIWECTGNLLSSGRPVIRLVLRASCTIQLLYWPYCCTAAQHSSKLYYRSTYGKAVLVEVANMVIPHAGQRLEFENNNSETRGECLTGPGKGSCLGLL